MELAAIAEYVLIGCIGGTLGSMLGLGGSLVVIPLATVLLMPDKQQLQCAAMISNIAVATSALRRYHAMGAVDWRLARRIAPWALVAVLAGVAASVVVDSTLFRLLFAAFLLLVTARELRTALTANSSIDPPPANALSPAKASGIGSAMGLISGLLGVGGGVVAMPLLRTWAKLPVRDAAATSVCVMVPLSIVGAAVKAATLAAAGGVSAPSPLMGALLIAVALVPGALLGGTLGASLHKRIPPTAIHWTLIVWLPVSAVAMAWQPISQWLQR